MKQHLLRLSTLGLAASISATAFAQGDLPYIFTARPKYTFTAALKIHSSGANVKFGNLGTIPYEAVERTLTDAGIVQPTGNYAFHDGQVRTDAKSAAEQQDAVDAGTTVFTQDGKRYLTYNKTAVQDSAGHAVDDPNWTPTYIFDQNGDSLAYQPGQTRAWSYQDDSQVSDGSVNMHAYSAQSNGASREADSGASGGFELQLSRELGTIGRKGSSWGVTFSFGVTDINAKSAGIINSDLKVETGTFSLLGQPAPGAPYQAPTYSDLAVVNPDGTPLMIPVFDETGTQVMNPDGTPATVQKVVTGGLETTTPLAQNGTITNETKAGAARVDGRWQLKGAYYMMRMGPSFRYQITPRISISANAGLAGAYVGSVYSAKETLIFPDGAPILVTTSGPLSAPGIEGEIRNREFKLGYYGELNLEYWITFRTGFFVGLVYEHLGAYDQNLDGRTASVNIGAGTAFRVGVITRF